MKRAGAPDPQAFARVGADLVELYRNRPADVRGDMVESIIVYCPEAAHQALLRELEARGLA